MPDALIEEVASACACIRLRDFVVGPLWRIRFGDGQLNQLTRVQRSKCYAPDLPRRLERVELVEDFEADK